MSDNKTHINYTAKNIQDYFAGRLNADAMYAMEKAALDDPFLAEAMEGYELMQADEAREQLVFLKEKFNPAPAAKVIPIENKKTFSFWKIAATIAIIIGGLSITYLLTNQNPTQSIIAKANIEDKKNAESLSDKVTDTAVNEPDTVPESFNESDTELPQESVLSNSFPEVKKDSVFMYRPAITAKKNVKDLAGGGYVDDSESARQTYSSSNQINSNAEANNLAIKEGEYKARQVPAEAQAEANAKKSATYNFSGTVFGSDNRPLPFANVTVPAENVGTYADAKGNFKFVSSDSLLKVEIKSLGYSAKNFTLQNNLNNNKLFLEEDKQGIASKTFASGDMNAFNKNKRAVLMPDSVMSAEPADGWRNYDSYVNNNITIPEDVLQQKIHGEVEVSFDVLTNGAITNVKVDKSLCGDCDAEVLRLIKQGPRWKSKTGSKGTAKLKVKF